MLIQIFFLILGFVFLIKGAQVLIDGASALAKRLHVSELFIGLTLVAFGTSMPEFFIFLTSNFKNSPALGVGNILGANIANVLLVCGLAALIYPIKLKKAVIKKELPLGIGVIVLLLFLANNFFLGHHSFLTLGRIDGLVLLAFFAIFLYYTLGLTKYKNPVGKTDKVNLIKTGFYIIVGLIGLTLGGRWVVESATVIAFTLGLSQTVIGLTIIAIGTTLPELFASVIAAAKKNADLAIGNIIGSLIFNTTFILGFNALIKPIAFGSFINFGILANLLVILLLFYFALTGKQERKISRIEGAILLSGYLTYLIVLLWLG